MPGVEFAIGFNDRASATALKIAREFSRAKDASDKLASSMKTSGKSVKELQDLMEFKKSMRDMIPASEIDKLKKYNSEINHLEKNIRQLRGEVSSSKASANGGISIGGMASTLGIAYGVKQGITALNDYRNAALSTYAGFEKLEIILTNTLGSKGAAKDSLSMIRDFAAKTPFQVSELSDSFVKLANRGFVATRNELTNMGDLASVTGKSFDMLTEAILDAQTNEYERLKEFGIKAKTNGDKVTLSFKNQKVTIDNTSESIRKAILDFGKMKGVAGAMEKISGSLTGQTSNLEDSYENLRYVIGERLAPSQMRLNGIMKDTVDSFAKMIEYDPAEKIMIEAEQVNMLVGKLSNANASELERLSILEKLKEIAPEIAEGIDAENFSLKDLNKNLDLYNAKKHGESLLSREYSDIANIKTAIEKAKRQLAEKQTSKGSILSEMATSLTSQQYKEFASIMKNDLAAGMPMSHVYESQAAYLEGLGLDNAGPIAMFVEDIKRLEKYISSQESILGQEEAELKKKKKDIFGDTEKKEEPKKTEKSANNIENTRTGVEAVASGGARSTSININIGKQVENMIFQGGFEENKEAVRKSVEEIMLRALYAAQSVG